MSRPVALVTGASAGIGKAIATQLAGEGYDLILVARRQERLQELADTLQGNHRVESVDLTDKDARKALIERIADIEIEILVNNAGFGSNGPFAENDADGEVRQVELNVTALVDLSRRLLPGMLARKKGHILNIASTAAFQPGPYMSIYYATKAFVLNFTQGLAYELRGSGVTVTAHCPGATASEFGAIAGNDKARLFQYGHVATSEEVAAHALKSMRAGKPVAVHGFINAFLATATGFTPTFINIRVSAWLNHRI